MNTMNTTRYAGRGLGRAMTAHLCPAGGCRQKVRAGWLMCRPHWYQVPRPLRDAVRAAWRSGAGAGKPAHTSAVYAAIAAVREDR